MLQQQLKTSKFQLNILYNARKHGFEASTFHQHCDNKGKTIMICETDNNCIFGAYTSIPWSTDNQYHPDRNAFLLIIKNQDGDQRVIGLRTNASATHSIQHVSTKGPTFGKAINALSICNKPHLSANSYTNEDSSYEFEGNELCGGNDENGGAYYFKVKNYEVHQVL